MTFADLLNNVQKLTTLPELIRNDDRGAYTYPDDVVGKIYDYNGKLICFNSATYDELSKPLLQFIFENISSMLPDNSNVDNDLKANVDKLSETQDELIKQLDKLSEYVDSIPNNNVTEILQKLNENYEELITQIKVVKEQSDNLSKNYTETQDIDTDNLVTIIGNQIWEKLESKLDDLRTDMDDKASIQMLEMYQTKVQDLYNEILDKVTGLSQHKCKCSENSEITTVEKKDIMSTATSLPTQDISVGAVGTAAHFGFSFRGASETNLISKMIVLKQSGFTADDIILLSEKGLV